ncbi:MAG: ABC transporter ATP-binding protein [Deltaproteobacteria bacterium]|nr:ABC transporter ATP-binding protein [Deltaproteobacteria bacterium]
MGAILEAIALSKSFATPNGELHILRELELAVAPGETVAILGQSGVGKSTLLHVLGTLDRPTSGRVLFQGEDAFAKPPEELARFRGRSLGFIFQLHHLLPEFSALENVMMPGLLAGLPRAELRAKAGGLLEEAGLGHRIDQRVGKLSGGERQRVAVTRALVMDPALVLADEPTGNLDPDTGERVHELMLGLNRARGTALVVVTHNYELARRMGRALVVREGKLEPAAL